MVLEDIHQVSPCVDDTLDNYGSGFSVDTVKHQIIFDSKLMVFALFVYEYRTDMRKIGKLTDDEEILSNNSFEAI